MVGQIKGVSAPRIAAALILGALGYVAYEAVMEPIDTTPLVASVGPSNIDRPADQARPAAAAKPAEGLGNYAQTVSRPIFSPDRQPVVYKNAAITNTEDRSAAVSLPSQLQLVGLFRGNQTKALIRTASNSYGTWVKLGEDFEGWRLREVADNMAVLETGARRHELYLYGQGQR